METFSTLLALCVGTSAVTGEFPAQKPVMQSFDLFFNLRLNKGLSKQPLGWWFETAMPSLWRQCNDALSDHVSYATAFPQDIMVTICHFYNRV